MPTQKQRREAARRHLERQVQRRAQREAARKRFTLIASVIGTLVVIALVIVLVAVVGKGGKKQPAASATGSSSTSASATSSTTASASASPNPTPSVTYKPATGKSVTFKGVTVKGAADLKGYPTVTSTATKDPAKLEYKDLVVGKGKAATDTSTVKVQYVGVLYKGGKTPFDSSWARGSATSFALTEVVKGFTYGIGGGDGLPPMKVGGRRLIIMPASLGYGSQANGSIPANSPLVFVVDLVSIS